MHIYDLAMNVAHGSPRAYASACVLVCLLLGINATLPLLLRMGGLRARPPAGSQR